MDPATGGALIAGGSQVVSNIVSNMGSRRAAKFAAKKNLEQWHRQNAYNHPLQQMERLKSAGLNPNLIYGTSPSSAVGNASDIPRVNAPEYRFDSPMADIHRYYDVRQKEAQTDNLAVQSNVLAQEGVLKGLQASQVAASTARTVFDLDVARELKQTSIDSAKELLRQQEVRTLGLQLDNKFKDQGMKDRLTDIYYQAQIARETLSGKKLDNVIKDLDIQLKRLGIEKNDPWYFRILGRNPQLGDGLNSKLQDLKDNARQSGRKFRASVKGKKAALDSTATRAVKRGNRLLKGRVRPY